jgi:hypothetical protein
MIVSMEGTLEYLDKMKKSVLKPASVLAMLYAVIAFGGVQAVDYYKTHRDAKEKIVSERVLGFIDSTKEFDSLVAVLAHGIMDTGKSDAAARAKLITNLNKQYSEVENLAPIVRDKQVPAEYKQALAAFNDQIPKVQSVQEMRPYWEAVSKVIQTRKPLTGDLVRRANLALD